MEEKKEVVTRSLILGILLIILGVLGIVFAGNIFNVLGNIVGWVVAGIFFIAGIINIVVFVLSITKKDEDKNPAIKNLIIGILSIAAGVVLVITPKLIVWIISVFLGVFLLLDGGFKVKEAFAANKAKAKLWFVSLIFGIIGIVLGALAIVYPFKFGMEVGKIFVILISVFLGVFLLLDGGFKVKEAFAANKAKEPSPVTLIKKG